MKTLLILACLYFAPALRAVEIDVDRLVEAIRMAENSPRAKIGRAGERSEYQITPAVWRQHSTWPLYMAMAQHAEAVAEQRRVALAHVDWLRKHVKHPTAYRLAMAWNAGAGAVNRGTVPRDSADYAQRVVNLYEEMNAAGEPRRERGSESTK